ncbi:radial spoke head protein, putative [Ichthyophthirius multifiliis]|uniref:Radial spoke head protein, putative n=1 Tax=Ichthyophthirius multifiliis TaxID=5932 RepID=G0R1X7_ICHMU|nr:radial spoke head protein, putative [Ichthyophthirius multifiliis]EGR28529.1 radial spoke head protein, putative [Ichthyophthirius multifiliis]|eukprot:XP_004029765.1 radial spoke head protein, putative [Ichthyophthirius multifiliis]
MFDKHVVRGNTYARIITSKDSETALPQRHTQYQKKNLQSQIKDISDLQKDQYEPQTPKPLPGRQNVEIMTDEYVETLTDKPPNYEKDTQTEFIIPKPNPILIMPCKTGLDRETQIWDGDLFDFDYEVEPLLQALIGKTLEFSRMEVLEEEELRVMKNEQKKFTELRNKEQDEVRQLEEKEKRLLEENTKRKNDYKQKLKQNILAHQQILSRNLAKKYLLQIKKNTLQDLQNQNIFYDPVKNALFEDILPWFYTNVEQILNTEQKIDKSFELICTEIVENTIKQHSNVHQKYIENRKKAIYEQKIQQQELEERREKKRIAREKKQEQERRNKITEEINQRIHSKGELKNNVLQQNICDIDGAQQNKPFVGLMGGLIGEFLLFLKALSQYSDEEIAQTTKEILSNTDKQGLAKVKPNLQTLTLNPQSERSGKEQFNENEEIVPFIPENIVEAEYENKVTIFVPNDQDLEVFVVHLIAEQVIRNEILRISNAFIKNIDSKEYFILYELDSVMQNIHQQILDYIQPDYPIFDLNNY